MMQKIYNTRDLAEANLIVALLAEKGIRPVPVRTVPQLSSEGIEMLYRVELPSEQLEKAHTVLKPYGYWNEP